MQKEGVDVKVDQKEVRLLFEIRKIVATYYPCLANAPQKSKLDLDVRCRDHPQTSGTAGS